MSGGGGPGVRAPALVAAATCLLLGSTAAAQRQPGWEVRLSERVEVTTGQPGTLALALAVDRGLTVSRDAAVIVDLAAPPDVVIKRRRLGRGDAADPGADAPRFAIPVRTDIPGEHVIAVRVRFWLCGARVCRPVDVRRRAVVVAVAPPPAPLDAPPDAGVPPVDAPPPPRR